jgi:hypothetical protein
MTKIQPEMAKSVFRIRNHLTGSLSRHFAESGSRSRLLLNPQTKVFYDKEHFFLKSKRHIMSSLTPTKDTKDFQAPGVASRPAENFSNMKFIFFFFWKGRQNWPACIHVRIQIPDQDIRIRIQSASIRIRNTDKNTAESFCK